MQTLLSTRGGGGGGAWGGGNTINGIVRMCVPNAPPPPTPPPFTALPGTCIWLAPFFRKKVYDWPTFAWLVYERPHFFWHPSICTYFSLREFWGCLFSWYSMNWLHYFLTTSNKMGTCTKSQRAVYEWVIISDDLVYEWVRFFKGQLYEWGRFRNTGSHTRSKITPIYKNAHYFFCILRVSSRVLDYSLNSRAQKTPKTHPA